MEIESNRAARLSYNVHPGRGKALSPPKSEKSRTVNLSRLSPVRAIGEIRGKKAPRGGRSLGLKPGLRNLIFFK
jgi:hypothetical protein